MYKLIIKHDMSTWHMKVRVIRVFRVPDCDTRITQNNFGFCKLLPEIPKQNSGFEYFGFGFWYSGFGFRVLGYGFFAQPYNAAQRSQILLPSSGLIYVIWPISMVVFAPLQNQNRKNI
jgi:hypothetical protein